MAQVWPAHPTGADSTVRIFDRVLADIGMSSPSPSPVHLPPPHDQHRGYSAGGGLTGPSSCSTSWGGHRPVEGAALAAAIIESRPGIGSWWPATTHYMRN